jgi:acyl-CoA reductase-like NAD-dependent aldehyde dehydrogenase
VWYAGWSDKYQAVHGTLNPVAGPYFDISAPEPTGVVAAIAPQHSSLLGLVSVVAPIMVAGNTVVVVASQERPLPAVTLAEALATSDVPGGVVNVLTGLTDELAPVLAAHLDVNALDLTGCAGTDVTALEAAAAENVKRLLQAEDEEPDWSQPPAGPRRILAFCETKTVWHPKGI